MTTCPYFSRVRLLQQRYFSSNYFSIFSSYLFIKARLDWVTLGEL